MSSWAHWSGHAENPQQWLEDNLEQNCERFLSYARGYEAARERHGARLYLNQFERLCLNPAPELERIFNFLGLQFDTEFLEFSSEHFVYGSTVSTDYLYPYRKSFTAGLNQEILARTAEFSHWHFHVEEGA